MLEATNTRTLVSASINERQVTPAPRKSARAFLTTVLVLLLAGGLVREVRAAGLDLSPYRGKVVYVDFWASWCVPCRESFPWLSNLVGEYGAKDLVVIAVNVDQDRQLAEQFLRANAPNFPILYDPAGEIATAFKITGMPSAVIVDRAGHVRFQHVGFSQKRKATYEDHLRSLLNEPAH
jgi:cytochrome c biogenesis protein CcmG, thiol:disulfide interchange protein DsbE